LNVVKVETKLFTWKLIFHPKMLKWTLDIQALYIYIYIYDKIFIFLISH
jgi:hypothetical protein